MGQDNSNGTLENSPSFPCEATLLENLGEGDNTPTEEDDFDITKSSLVLDSPSPNR